MDPDVPNPAFQQAIPHGMDGIGQLLQVVIFGSFPGSQKGAKMGPQMDPKRGPQMDSNRD